MIRPQPWRIISGTTAFVSVNGAVVRTVTKRRHYPAPGAEGPRNPRQGLKSATLAATTSSSSIDSGEQTRLIPRSAATGRMGRRRHAGERLLERPSSSTEIHPHLRDDLGYICGVIGALGHYISVSIR